jgi:hypothetical protein
VQHATADAGGHERTIVGNIGIANAGPFRVAVLAGAYSYSIMVPGLEQGMHSSITLKALPCGQPVAVILDMDKQTGDSNYGNNSTGFKPGCPIDPGADLKDVSE